MNKSTAQAIADLSNSTNKSMKRLNEMLSARCDNSENKIKSHDDDISDLYDYVADSIYNDCLTDLGLSEEESEVN